MKKILLIFGLLFSTAFASTPDCPPGKIMCNGICVDPSTDANNFGACGFKCPKGAVCISGVCSCPQGTIDCGNNCVYIQSDTNNCGTCGHVCPKGAICVNGVCTCPPGNIVCVVLCVNPLIDVNNCGTCGHRCAPGEICLSGNCRPSVEGVIDIDNDPNTVFVYPIPVKDRVQIKTTYKWADKFSITIYDISGQLIEEINKQDVIVSEHFSSIPIPGNIPAGVFFLSVESPGFNKVIKIVKE